MINETHFHDVSSALLQFREEGFLCDTILITGNKALRAHSVILAAASIVLKGKFQAKTSCSLNYIYLPEFDFYTLKVALHFIYSGSLLLPNDYRNDDDGGYRLATLLSNLGELGLNKRDLTNCEISYTRCVVQLCVQVYTIGLN